MRSFAFGFSLLLSVSLPVHANQLSLQSSTVLATDGQVLNHSPWKQTQLIVCEGRFCCCRLRGRGILCAPKSKCKGGGEFCLEAGRKCRR